MDPITRDYAEACRILDRKGHGTIRMKDGLVIKGGLSDIQSPLNDPDGIGYISIDEGAKGLVSDVYADEFEALLEVW